ncbi:alpha/beta hydrolase [Nocardia sp. NPDC088792]|uniref:alpha/beta hydrolase n=1 Tax=Nocardia sp. NPDC088792 TaxID=3364332 RepID=UPI00382A80E4
MVGVFSSTTARSAVTAIAGTALAPLAGVRMSYLVCHPPRLGRPARLSELPEPVDLTISVPGQSGTLHGWLFPGDPHRVVAIGHSIGADKSFSVSYARYLVEAGYTVLLFDFRNHGRSFDDRSVTGFSRRFADDLIAAVAHVRAMPAYADSRWALYGLSMSSFAAVHALSGLSRVEAVVCDSGPAADPGAAVRNLLRQGMFPLPDLLRGRPAADVFAAVFGPLTAIGMSRPRPWPPAPDGPVAATPMLFLVGEDDEVVAPDEVAALAAPFPRAQVARIPGAGHLKAMKVDPAGYQARVLGFLADTLGVPETVS